jgi:hypothetical protein
MHEARLVRFGAGKAHLGAALHALRVFVETLGLVLWHLSTAWSAAGTFCKLQFHNSKVAATNQNLPIHTLEVFRTAKLALTLMIRPIGRSRQITYSRRQGGRRRSR